MPETTDQSIAQSLFNFQAALTQSGSSLESFISEYYLSKWRGDAMYHVMAIRTSLINAMQQFFADEGLFNMERISMSPVTDPLAHDVEHLPAISYKGHTYVTTHSMIYAKFLACFNPRLKGIFVDSPNIRLELESPAGRQRKKYLIDFSQMDVEVRRNRGVTLEQYYHDTNGVSKILAEDFERALSFFERMLVRAAEHINAKNAGDLRALGVRLDVPEIPLPRFYKDEAERRFGKADLERALGRTVKGQFFWITGILRENYDLVYPYLRPDGSRVALSEAGSDTIYNYDLCARALRADGTYGDAYEVLSGAVREWLYEPIIQRLLDNRIIPVRPVFSNGNLENIDELGGYGPFITAVKAADPDGKALFPDTFGGGIGVERTLFTLCAGEKITKVDDVTLFGKNPDSHPLYLF